MIHTSRPLLINSGYWYTSGESLEVVSLSINCLRLIFLKCLFIFQRYSFLSIKGCDCLVYFTFKFINSSFSHVQHKVTSANFYMRLPSVESLFSIIFMYY